MSWKKYFKTVDTGNLSPIGARGGSTPDLGFKNYQSTYLKFILDIQTGLKDITNMNQWMLIRK